MLAATCDHRVCPYRLGLTDAEVRNDLLLNARQREKDGGNADTDPRNQAAKSRPLAKLAPSPIAATIALAMIGPIPGTVINRPQLTSVRAKPSISSVTPATRY
jgi:hypothetical protein